MKVLRTGLGLLVLLSLPVAAHAQDRGFFRPTVGATVGAGPGAVFSGTFGVNAEKVHKGLTVLGEFGRMTNIIPSKVADQVEVTAANVATSLGGGKASSSSKATANYGLGGVRYRFRDVSGAQTFGEFGVGVANVHSTVTARIIGSSTVPGNSSIASQVTTPFTLATPETKPMASIGGGIVLAVTKRTAVEMGCRYLHIFTQGPAVNAAKIFGGFRLAF
jgi:hypothetical protein